MAHQKVSLHHDQTTPIVFDTSDPGTGKTAVRIWAYAGRRRLAGKQRAGCLLVLAPRSLLRAAWANDFAKFSPDLKVVVATAANRAQAFNTEADVYITNHDAVKELIKLPKTYWDKFTDLVIDESPAYKHHTSQRSRAAQKLSTRFIRRACLTGTPTSNGVCDIWHQAFLLDGGKRLGPNFFGFRNSVCTGIQKSRSNRHAIEWVDKDGAEEAVFNQLHDIVVRHKFEDCVDIPKTHVYTVPYELTPKQRAAYSTLLEDKVMPLLSAQSKGAAVAAKLTGAPPPALTAVNAAAVITKLLQISSGAVYDSSGKYHVIDRARYETVMDMVEVRKHPLVLFFWQHQRDLLVEEAEKRGLTYCVFDGDSSDSEREFMRAQYQLGKYDVMFGHPKTVGHGLTLTAGTSTIWTCPTYDLEWWKQASKRQARIGQKQKTEVVVMVAEDTTEERIYHDILMSKSNRMTNLLDLFGSVTKELEAA